MYRRCYVWIYSRITRYAFWHRFQVVERNVEIYLAAVALGLIGILNQVADKICYKFIVPGQEGEVQLGIYGACVKIAMIIAIFTQAFRYAYEPFVFGGQKDKNSREMQAEVMKYYVIFTLLAFLLVVLYLDIFKFIIQRNYWEGLRTIPIVMMAEIFMGVYFNLSFWYKLNKQTWWGLFFPQSV